MLILVMKCCQICFIGTNVYFVFFHPSFRIDIRAELLKFHSTYYSSNAMKLVVLGIYSSLFNLVVLIIVYMCQYLLSGQVPISTICKRQWSVVSLTLSTRVVCPVWILIHQGVHLEPSRWGIFSIFAQCETCTSWSCTGRCPAKRRIIGASQQSTMAT